MKRNLLKKGICGVILGCVLSFGVGLVNAELTGKSQTVKVGNADAPVYSYEINMDSFGIYDWVYDNDTQSYSWQNGCKEYTYEAGMGTTDGMFSDSKCTTEVGSLKSGDKYYVQISNSIQITDNSTYGSISADVEYTPSENYKWTGMEINTHTYECVPVTLSPSIGVNYTNFFMDDECTFLYEDEDEFLIGESETYTYDVSTFANVLTSETYDEYPSSYSLDLKFNEIGVYIHSYLNGSRRSDITFDKRTATAEFIPFIPIVTNAEETSTPVAGDILGTVTVNIHAAL